MAGLIGFWFAVVGGIATLAGLTARRRVVRLRRSGQSAWGMIVPSPVNLGEADGWPRRNLVQYSLTDGRVLERICPRPVRRAGSSAVGERVHVWYDPADPTDVLVNGWDGRYSDLAFLTVGVFFIVFGLGIAFGH
jgi:hypothetical protein